MIRCSELFTDNMVLQRDKQVCVWGESDNCEEVCITIDGMNATADVKEGFWSAYLPQHSAGGPYTMSIKQGDETITFTEVMYGEVLLASGQSNMEMALANSENGLSESKAWECSDVRYYNVLKVGYVDSQVEEDMRRSKWTSCIDGKSADMSAVAYYAAKKLYEEMKIPVGIIDCYQGGTSIASWLPVEVLSNYKLGKERLDEYNAQVGDKTEEEYELELKNHAEAVNNWEKQAEVIRKENPKATHEDIVAVAGEYPWQQPVGWKSIFRPGGGYDSMVRRVTPYTIKAIMYYQGESDEDKASDYYPVMKALIDDWRKQFGEDELPFVITQLPMYIEEGREDDCRWAVIRNHQLAIAENVAAVSLLTLVDCGEYGNIHPLDKKTPGTRLGALLLEELYGIDSNAKAMIPENIYRQDNEIVIECLNTYGQICSGDGLQDGPVMEFEVLYQDESQYISCDYRIDDNRIILTGENLSNVNKVRYGWKNYGNVKIFNKAGIPLATFGDREIR